MIIYYQNMLKILGIFIWDFLLTFMCKITLWTIFMDRITILNWGTPIFWALIIKSIIINFIHSDYIDVAVYEYI
jgi:hypothetical protein